MNKIVDISPLANNQDVLTKDHKVEEKQSFKLFSVQKA